MSVSSASIAWHIKFDSSSIAWHINPVSISKIASLSWSHPDSWWDRWSNLDQLYRMKVLIRLFNTDATLLLSITNSIETSYHSLQKAALAVAAQRLVSTTVQNDIVTSIIVKDQTKCWYTLLVSSNAWRWSIFHVEYFMKTKFSIALSGNALVDMTFDQGSMLHQSLSSTSKVSTLQSIHC